MAERDFDRIQSEVSDTMDEAIHTGWIDWTDAVGNISELRTDSCRREVRDLADRIRCQAELFVNESGFASVEQAYWRALGTTP